MCACASRRPPASPVVGKATAGAKASVPLWSFLKNFDILSAEAPFRRSQVGLRRAETAFRNFEAPLLFDYIRDPMKISGLQNGREIGEKN